jgi:DUF218 domain
MVACPAPAAAPARAVALVALSAAAVKRPETEAMRELLRARGVPDVLVGPAARTTTENARHVDASLARRPLAMARDAAVSRAPRGLPVRVGSIHRGDGEISST